MIVILFSCNVTKHVPDGEYLLEKNEIIVNNKKESNPDVISYLQQKPNEKLLGIPFSLHIYNWGNPDTTSVNWPKDKLQKKLTNIFSEKQVKALKRSAKNFNKWKLKSGNAPVISDEKKIKKSVKSLQKYYVNNGYWDTEVNFEESKKADKKVNVTYNVITGEPYFLDTISQQIESSVLDSLYILNKSNSFLKQNQQYKYDNFEKEQQRLTDLFRNSGIFKFSNNDIEFVINDTTSIDSRKHNVLLKVSNKITAVNDSTYEKTPYKVQKVKTINVFTDYNFQNKGLKFRDSTSYDGFNFYATDKLKYNPKYLSNAIVIKPNGVYRDDERDLTRKYLRELENFRAGIDIKYEENKDESLTANIYLSPLKKFGLTWDADFTTSSNKPFGILGKFGFINRNVFKGAEILELSFQGSFINTTIGATNNQLFFNALEIGTNASLKIPRIFFPLKTQRIIPKRMTPKTNITFSMGLQKNIGLDRQNITGSLDYTWQSKKTTSHKLELLNLQYINNRNTNKYFDIYRSELRKLNEIAFDRPANNQLNTIPVPDSLKPLIYLTNSNGEYILDENNFVQLIPDEYIKFVLANSNNFANTNPLEYAYINNVEQQRKILVEDVLVPVISYEYNYNNRKNYDDNSFSTFTGRLISSGSLTTSFIKKTNSDGRKSLFGLPVAQYFKTEFEHKKYWALNQNSTLVMRNFVGAAIPFGNSEDIPFSRSYRAGGSNDIRAWRTFELGLGSENSTLEFNVGSLKFTSNLEYRFKLINSLNAALFIDAGNIWDISKTNLTSSKGKFKGLNSIKDIAIGSGIGARYDFSFLIFRLDLGFKTYEPYLDSSSKWFKNYNFKNSVLQIGINYPF